MSPPLILPEAQASEVQLRHDYENQLEEAQGHKKQLARQTSLLKQREAQLNTEV
jgi:hypothetical protein